MDDDFNTGAAISDVFELVRTLNKSVDQHNLEDPSARTEQSVSTFKQGVATLRELTDLHDQWRREIETGTHPAAAVQ